MRVPGVLAATSLPLPLAGLRTIRARGTVLARFERSVYLDLGGRLVAVASDELGRGPFTITFNGLPTLPYVAGAVTLEHGQLRVAALSVDLTRAAAWNPALRPAPVAALAADTRAAVIDELLSHGPEGSIAKLLECPSPRGPLLDALSRGLRAVDVLLTSRADPGTALEVVASEVAGRGHGLTPSGDDLLMGILHALSAWPSLTAARESHELRRLLAGVAGSRTSRISAAYLDAAGRGWATEPWHVFVGRLGGPRDDLRAAVRTLLRVGETSGADALTGFCWAWRRLTRLPSAPAYSE